MGQKLHRTHFASIFCITTGLVIIALRGFSAGLTLSGGDALLVLSSLCYGFGDILFPKYLKDAETHIVVFVRSLIALSGMTIIILATRHPAVTEILSFPWELLPTLIGFAFISRFLNTLCFYQALDHLPVPTVSLLSILSVVFSICFAAFLLAEPILPYQFIGGIFIILGSVLLETLGNAHASKEHHRAHMHQRHAHRA